MFSALIPVLYLSSFSDGAGCLSASVTCQNIHSLVSTFSVTPPDRRHEEFYLGMQDAAHAEMYTISTLN